MEYYRIMKYFPISIFSSLSENNIYLIMTAVLIADGIVICETDFDGMVSRGLKRLFFKGALQKFATDLTMLAEMVSGEALEFVFAEYYILTKNEVKLYRYVILLRIKKFLMQFYVSNLVSITILQLRTTFIKRLYLALNLNLLKCSIKHQPVTASLSRPLPPRFVGKKADLKKMGVLVLYA